MVHANAAQGMFPNPHLMERPDRGDPAIDFVGFRRPVFRGLL